MRKEEQAKEKKFFFENKDNLKRDAIHKKHGSMLLKAAGGEPIQTKGKNKKLPTCQDLEVDEMGTIHLIETLDADSKKLLNGLVQSVLVTQMENDKDKLSLLAQKRKIVQDQ